MQQVYWVYFLQVPDIKTIKMKIQTVFLLLFLNACTRSSIHIPGLRRPWHQIVTKGVLNNFTDTLKVITVFSYSESFENRRFYKSLVANTQHWRSDSIRFLIELDTFLSKRKMYYQFVKNKDNFNFVYPILDRISPNSDTSLSYQLSKNINDSNTLLIIYARFNINHIIDRDFGSTTPVEQIISHAIITKNGTLLYHRTNYIRAIFPGNKFHRKSITKVLDDAFKK